jgi:hypothetical protein
MAGGDTKCCQNLCVLQNVYTLRFPVAARSKPLVFDRSPAQIVGSNPTGGMDVCVL